MKPVCLKPALSIIARSVFCSAKRRIDSNSYWYLSRSFATISPSAGMTLKE